MRPDETDPSRTEASLDHPIDASRYAWPDVELDPVVRMRALAAGLPHAASSETIFSVPFDRLWSFITDFEVNTPRFEGMVGRARVLERDGERVTLEARGPLIGPWMRFDVIVRPGWCLMKTRMGDVGMAARPESASSTRFFHFEGSAVLGRIARPLFAWNIRQDFVRLRALL